jgi:hypothetical protein
MNLRDGLIRFAMLSVSLVVLLTSGIAQKTTKPSSASLIVAITRASSTDSALHWAITNHNEIAVFVYDFFLWGPAFSVDHSSEKTKFNTSPVRGRAVMPPESRCACALACLGLGRCQRWAGH